MLISTEQLIVQSFSLYHKHWRRVLPYVALFAFPSFATLLVKFIFAFVEKNVLTIGTRVLLMTLFSLVSLGCTMMIIRVLAQIVKNDKPDSILEEFKQGARLIWPALLSSILVGLAVLGGFILLVIPGIIFAIWFAFTAYAVALDEKKGVHALRASHELVRGRWWQVFWRLALPGLLFGFMAWVLQNILHLPFRWMFEEATTQAAMQALVYLATIVNMLVALAILPLSTLAPTLLYLDLKKNPVKKE